VTSPKEKDDKNHEADDPLAPILGAANAIFKRDGLRFRPADKADAGAVVDRISMPVLRAEMIALAQGLQTALGELRLKGQLRSSVQVVSAAAAPDLISLPDSSSANHKIPFLREFLGAPTADELVWYLPTLADALYEASTVQQQQHAANTESSSPSNSPKKSNNLPYVDLVQLTVGDTAAYLTTRHMMEEGATAVAPSTVVAGATAEESAVTSEPAAAASVTATTGPAVAASTTTTEPVVAAVTATTTKPAAAAVTAITSKPKVAPAAEPAAAAAAATASTTKPVVAATTGPAVAAKATTEPVVAVEPAAAAAATATTTKHVVAATTTTTGPAVAATATVATKPKTTTTTTTVIQDAPKPAARDSVSVQQPTKAPTTSQSNTINVQQRTQATTTTPPRLLRATRVVTPPVLHDAMELNEWAVGLSFLEVVKPSQSLLDHLLLAVEGDDNNSNNTNGVDCVWQTVLVPVINKTLLRLSQEHLTEKTTRKAPVVVQTGQVAGLVQVQGELTPDKQLCKVVVAFFYHALEAVLYCEKERWKVPNNNERNRSTGNMTMPTSVATMQDEEMATPTENAGCNSDDDERTRLQKLVMNPNFHAALLACCTSCVTKAIGCTQKLHPSSYLRNLQIYSILHVTGTTSYEFLKVSETFLRALTTETAAGKLGSTLLFGLPRTLQRNIRREEVNILDSLLWARNGTAESLPDKIEDLQEKTAKQPPICLWPPQVLAPSMPEEKDDTGKDATNVQYPGPDHEDYVEIRCISYILRKLLRLAYYRIEALCRYLQIPSFVTAQVWITFRYLVRNRLELLYDRHVDHWILCCVYGVSRSIKYDEPELKFAKIIEAYVAIRESELGAVTCQRIVRHIKIGSNDKNAPAAAGSSSSSEGNMGNVIALYNRVFVPAMKEHLVDSKSLKRCAAALAEVKEWPSNKGLLLPGLHLRLVGQVDHTADLRGPTALLQLGVPGDVATANQFSTPGGSKISVEE